MKNIIMDGKALQVPDDYTILAAARHNDIEIPTLCYLLPYLLSYFQM